MISRKSHPSILDVSQAFLYYFHISANAAAETLSAQQIRRGSAGQRERTKYEGPGPRSTARRIQRDGPNAARRSEKVRPERAAESLSRESLLPEIHSRREARAPPVINSRPAWAPPSRPAMKYGGT